MTDATPILEQALCFADACPDCVQAGRCLSPQAAHNDYGEDVAAQMAALAKAEMEIRPVPPLAARQEPLDAEFEAILDAHADELYQE